MLCDIVRLGAELGRPPKLGVRPLSNRQGVPLSTPIVRDSLRVDRRCFLSSFRLRSKRGETAGPRLREAIGGKFDAHFLRMIGPDPVGRLDGIPLPLSEMEKLIADLSAQ